MPCSSSAGLRQPLRQVELALRHPKVTLIANALGTPPADMIKRIHDSGPQGCGAVRLPAQALKHADADVDIIIAQGGEGGGHCGEVGSIALWPQVVKGCCATAGPGGGRHRQRLATDRGGAGHGLPGRVVGFAVADGRGSREHSRPAGGVRQREQSGHGA